MRALMWFRSDLRVQDNTALHYACKAADEGVIAVFTVCAKQWSDHDWGSMKVDFVLRNVRALSEALAKLNIPLKLVRTRLFTSVPAKLLQVAKQNRCNALFFNREHEVNERERDRAVKSRFEKEGMQVRSFMDQVILDVEAIKTNLGGWYTVFTPFKRKWCAALEEHDPPRIWSKPRRQVVLNTDSDPVPDELRGFTAGSRSDLWPAGEKEAAKRLRRFAVERIEGYHKNRDFPAVDGTSTLSPYLSAGVISPRQCLETAVAANNGLVDSGKPGISTWISELIWREFYRHILIGFPRVCRNRPFKPETDKLPWRQEHKQFGAWCAGRTGFPLVDAGMRQLVQTGWMHNRVRMVVAMFLTKDLFIDWRWGERYFMQNLVDGDLASNNGGWQWSTSTGTDAAPYFRIFNPFSQSSRYDPDGNFIRRFVPELSGLRAPRIHRPHDTPSQDLDYPQPIVDRQQTRQLVLQAFRRLPKKARAARRI
jgi:deoxyribodipyrimidine photo-lyase